MTDVGHPGCEVCSYTDGGCSSCNPRPVAEVVAENDATEAALHAAGVAMAVAAAPLGEVIVVLRECRGEATVHAVVADDHALARLLQSIQRQNASKYPLRHHGPDAWSIGPEDDNDEFWGDAPVHLRAIRKVVRQ